MDRQLSTLLARRLKQFPCVAIIGPRQCGKTTLLQTLPKEWRHFDLEKRVDFNEISSDPDLFLRLNNHHCSIDEAQIFPGLFPALRVAIDADRTKKGRFVITGSSSPALLNSISESLAGRIAVIEMAPFSFAETEQFISSPFFDALTLHKPESMRKALLSCSARTDFKKVQKYWIAGGFPEPWLSKSRDFKESWMDQYIRSYIERDIARLFPHLDKVRFSLFIQLLANLSGTIINTSEVARALSVSQPTVRDYFEIAHGTFLWRKLPPYEKDAIKRIVKHPKGYLRDSGLLHHFLHIRSFEDLRVHPKMGASWESFVIEELLRGLASRGIPFDAYHYRTGGGAEIDLVLEGAFGVLPIEIKYGQTVSSRDLRSISDFVEERKLSLGIVINNDERPRAYTEKLLGIPFSCL